MANDAMAEAFVRAEGEKARDRKQEALTRKRNLGRSSPIKARSIKQKMLDAKWAGIKDAFLFLASRYEPDGTPRCEECGTPGDADSLDLHHLRRRGQGGEYVARNAALLCRPCHQEADGNDLRWSRSE